MNLLHQILSFARLHFTAEVGDGARVLGKVYFPSAGRIVIGHANHPGTIGALPRLGRLLPQRRLGTYTLDDVFSR